MAQQRSPRPQAAHDLSPAQYYTPQRRYKNWQVSQESLPMVNFPVVVEGFRLLLEVIMFVT